MAAFLALPGEIRNQIYQYTLVKESPYAVKLHLFTRDAALFRVNKQVYEEASSIFYHDNIFRFPQSLFDGPPIIEKLETFIRMSRRRLADLRNIKLDIPIYSSFDNVVMEADILRNTQQIAEFIYFHSGPGIRLQIDMGAPPLLDDSRLQPTDFWHIMYPWFEVQRHVLSYGGKFEIIMRIHPQHLGQCSELLEKHFENRWFIVANLKDKARPHSFGRLHYGLTFSDMLQARGLRTKFDEVIDLKGFMYTLSIRRDFKMIKLKEEAEIVQHEGALIQNS